MDNADSKNRGGMNRVGSGSVLGKPKMNDGSRGGLVKGNMKVGGGMGVAYFPRHVKKVPKGGRILESDAK